MRRIAILVLLAAACGGGGASSTPDAALPSDAAAPTGDATAFPACAEFAAAAVQVPAHVTSVLAGADLASPTDCASIDAPFGVESAGPDKVIPLKGLVVGATYVVRVTSTDDLAFYVVTGCSTATGPAPDQCLLFEDGSSGGSEVGTFIATASTAYVIVDFYASHPPSSLDFTLDVYARGLREQRAVQRGHAGVLRGPVRAVRRRASTAATSPRPCATHQRDLRRGRRCVPRATTPTSPRTTARPAPRMLVARRYRPRERARQAVLDAGSEVDFFAFDVTTLGETWDLDLAWTRHAAISISTCSTHAADGSGCRSGSSPSTSA